MSRRALLKVLASLCLAATGCGKSATDENKERPMPKDRLPPKEGQK